MRLQTTQTPIPQSLLPSWSKLFLTGATIGPFMDAIHNQRLLIYDVAPLHAGPLESSWIVPPLLGVAYVVLGQLMPRVVSVVATRAFSVLGNDSLETTEKTATTTTMTALRNRAFWAVAATVAILKLSEVLVSNQVPQTVPLLAAGTMAQWWFLDRTPTSLFVALLAAAFGPVSELPLVGHGCWHYFPEICDKFPLESLPNSDSFTALFGTSSFRELGLPSLTAPCYFAVTTDAIALGRWYASSDTGHATS